ncbi:MAG TPA: bacillithiol biosynthesis cysteine-adding enzyme BshC [Chitinophagaceae bacterium]|nr:bacillithiol biosynthesis cysteine-adding enzyme BshC [Chitinophagaceae bacterium]
MDCISTRIPYRQTGNFSKTVVDYIDQAPSLREFYNYPPTLQGIKKAIEDRAEFNYNRDVLVNELKKQYASLTVSDKTRSNIELLASANTFTFTTAHQNNIFTGPLYFIYKILHTIKLAENCKTNLPQYNFVPVFYMGTEDADLDELNHVYVEGQRLVWKTKQTGAVGRMKVDKDLVTLIGLIEGQLSVLPFGNELLNLMRTCYKEGDRIQQSTFKIVNALFGEYGLVVLLPDNEELKRQMIPIFKDDLLQQNASDIVEKTAERLDRTGYKVQANPREINLFYLKENARERIEKRNDHYSILNSQLSFKEDELLKELDEHPGRFSPNVILRGLYQETILPNLVFIGGGGETAYWLQLKDLFNHYKVPFPMLVLRNSFLIVERKWQERIAKLGFTIEDFFLSEQELMSKVVMHESKNDVKLNGALTELQKMYESFKKQAAAVDSTLEKHVEALKLRSVQRLQELEKKMLRAEKRKFTDHQRQINTIKEHLFPGNGLQERYDNFSYFYAKWGRTFIHKLYEHTLNLEQEFVIVIEK